ncbi:hypothetical protein FRC08_007448 [Ceratobasidium sp. 394]|nr:hypothetical protein FRC08_007448 [Ceratobasidium sp. 394]
MPPLRQTVLVFGAAPQLKPHIDSNLPPIRDGDLDEFHRRYVRLADLDGLDTTEFGPHTVFALTGHYTDDVDEQKYRMRIVPRTRPTQPIRLTQKSDIDSAIGFVFEEHPFPLPDGQFFYSVFNNTAFTLESSLHLPPYTFKKDDGTDASIPYHLIPNAVMGEIPGQSVRSILCRYMFPGLADTRQAWQGSKVGIPYMRDFFNHAVRPSVLAVLPATCHGEWPIDFDDEQYRARRHNGGVVFTPRSISAEYLTPFIASLHNFTKEVRAIKWAKGFFLQLQIQGTKQATRHDLEAPMYRPLNDPNDEPEEVTDDFQNRRGEALATAVHPLDLMALEEESWWFDVGTTVRFTDRGYSLLVDSSKHNWLLAAVTGLDANECGRLIARGTAEHYFCDETAHLGSAAGFRMELDPKDNPSRAAYVQVYTTEKSLVSLKDNKQFAKHTEPRFVLKNWKQQRESHFNPLLNVFENARDDDFKSDVRIESRIGLLQVMKGQRWIEPDTLANCTIVVPTKQAWQWRADRVGAAIATYDKLLPMIPDLAPQKIHGPLTLVIALCYMVNALVNRPEPGRDFVQLADTCSVHEIIRNVLTSVRPLSAFFLHSLPADPVPRLSSHRTLDNPGIGRLCGIKGDAPEGELRALLLGKTPDDLSRTASEAPLPTWGDGSTATAPEGQQKRSFGTGTVSRAKRLRINVNNDEPILEDDEVGIPEQDVAMAYDSEDEDVEVPAVGLSNREMIKSILRRMTVEMVDKIPDSKQSGTYRKIPNNEYNKVTFNTLCDSTQLENLLHCWRQTDDHSLWTKTVEKLFPTKSEFIKISTDKHGKLKTTYIQGLKQCSFYQDWVGLVSDTGLTTVQQAKTVEFVRKKIDDKAQWLPLGKSDRLWADNGGSKNAKVHGQDLNQKGGLVVVLNPRFCEDVDLKGGH